MPIPKILNSTKNRLKFAFGKNADNSLATLKNLNDTIDAINALPAPVIPVKLPVRLETATYVELANKIQDNTYVLGDVVVVVNYNGSGFGLTLQLVEFFNGSFMTTQFLVLASSFPFAAETVTNVGNILNPLYEIS